MSKNSTVTNLLIILGSIFIINTFITPEIKEGFLGNLPNFTVKAMKVSPNLDPAKNDFYNIPGYYQAALAPRFANVDYGAQIQYNMPDKSKLAVDSNNPLSLNSMVYQQPLPVIKELYGGEKSMAMPQFGNLNMKYSETTDMLPVQGMGSGQVVNAMGEATVQPVVYDRFIYANQKSRLQRQGDPIRGDLPIVPNNTGWFQVNINPQIDLQPGAMAVMGGIDGGTTREMAALRNASAGGLITTGSGISYAVQSSPYTVSAGTDVVYQSFP